MNLSTNTGTTKLWVHMVLPSYPHIVHSLLLIVTTVITQDQHDMNLN